MIDAVVLYVLGCISLAFLDTDKIIYHSTHTHLILLFFPPQFTKIAECENNRQINVDYL